METLEPSVEARRVSNTFMHSDSSLYGEASHAAREAKGLATRVRRHVISCAHCVTMGRLLHHHLDAVNLAVKMHKVIGVP